MTLEQRVRELIDTEISEALAGHSGGCELVRMDDDVAVIRLTGNCTRCPGRRHTFFNKVKPYVVSKIDGLKDVVLE